MSGMVVQHRLVFLVQPTQLLNPLVNKLPPPQVFQLLPVQVRLRFPSIRLREHFLVGE